MKQGQCEHKNPIKKDGYWYCPDCKEMWNYEMKKDTSDKNTNILKKWEEDWDKEKRKVWGCEPKQDIPDNWNENIETCSSCGIKWKKIGKPCPVCYSPLEKDTRQKARQELIEDLINYLNSIK